MIVVERPSRERGTVIPAVLAPLRQLAVPDKRMSSQSKNRSDR
jgi:hypothetical protein